MGKLRPGLAIKGRNLDQATVLPHLLEEEGYACSLALIAGGTGDGELISGDARAGSGFEAENDQVEFWKVVEDGAGAGATVFVGGDAVKGVGLAAGVTDRADVTKIDQTEGGLITDKMPARRGLEKVKDAPISGSLILHGCSQPNVIRHGQFRIFKSGETSDRPHTIGAFGEEHEGVPGGLYHDGKDLLDEFDGNIGMEEVRHRVDEDPAGFPPVQGNGQAVGMDHDIGEFAVLPKTPGKAFGVAVGASPAHLCAA